MASLPRHPDPFGAVMDAAERYARSAHLAGYYGHTTHRMHPEAREACARLRRIVMAAVTGELRADDVDAPRVLAEPGGAR